MSSVEKFLQIVKKYQEDALNLLQEIEDKKDKTYQVVFKRLSKPSFEAKLNLRIKNIQDYDIKDIQQIGFQYFELPNVDSNTLDDENLIDTYQIYYTATLMLKSNIKYYNLLSQAFKNNKVKNYIDIRLILQLLIYGWTFEDLSIQDVSTILGMTLKRDSLIKVDDKLALEINNLAKFYTSSGKIITFYKDNFQGSSYEYSEYLSKFTNGMRSLCLVYTDYSIFREKRVNPTYKLLLEAVVDYFIVTNNQDMLKTALDSLDVKIEKDNSTSQINFQEKIDYLKEYYQNGYLIKLPEDREEFYKNLQLAPISKKEKEYIKQLLNKSLNDPLIKFLNPEELKVYWQILTDIDSLKLIQKDVNSLLEIFSLEEECHSVEDQEILTQEKEAIIQKWQSYLQAKETSNIIFLNSPNQMSFLEDDILDNWHNLYPSLKQGLIALQNKKLPLELLNPVKGVDFAFYVAHCEKIDIYLIEVCLGTYVAVGATLKGQKYRFIQNRVFKYQEELAFYQDTILDKRSANNLLQEELMSWQELVRIKE